MLGTKVQSWGRLRVQRKVELVLFCLLTPLLCALAVHVYLIDKMLGYQDTRHDIVLLREQIGELRRFSIDIEDAFRGYLISRRPDFLAPMHEAESRLSAEIERTAAFAEGHVMRQNEIAALEKQVRNFLASKHDLIQKFDQGHYQEVLEYVRAGRGVELADTLRAEFRKFEDQLDREIDQYNERAEGLSEAAYRGLVAAVFGTLFLGWVGALVLSRSVTDPLEVLRNATKALGKDPEKEPEVTASLARISSADEIGELARSYEDMAQRIRAHLRELEALQVIGQEINTIGPDGVAGVLRRITDRAVELVRADVCLVLVRNDQMGCWIIEAASKDWHDRLCKSVMLWEELPISVQAFETGQLVTGEHLRENRRPELSRRNLIGNSMLAAPLVNQGVPFGVLFLASEEDVPADLWNRRLALGLAQEAAVAISNARLYEIVHEKHQSVQARVRQLEHLAEALAHDLKGPGQRMAELATLLQNEYTNQLDERAKRWLTLVQQNGKELTDRAEGILAVARVGARRAAVTFVDPNAVIGDVVKSRAVELERARAHVNVTGSLPLVACHSAYLRQVIDNLISNSVKFAKPEGGLTIAITGQRQGKMLHLSVADNGIGIPAAFHHRVFDAFVRLDPSRTSGSGIGLSIVQRIVELSGGKVWVEACSGPETGTTITFSLPLLEDWDRPAAAPFAGREHLETPQATTT